MVLIIEAKYQNPRGGHESKKKKKERKKNQI